MTINERGDAIVVVGPHFLAKASVENLLAFRAADPLFERALRSDAVQACGVHHGRGFGVEGRGCFE